MTKHPAWHLCRSVRSVGAFSHLPFQAHCALSFFTPTDLTDFHRCNLLARYILPAKDPCYLPRRRRDLCLWPPRMESVSICAICGLLLPHAFSSALCAWFFSHRSHRFAQMFISPDGVLKVEPFGLNIVSHRSHRSPQMFIPLRACRKSNYPGLRTSAPFATCWFDFQHILRYSYGVLIYDIM